MKRLQIVQSNKEPNENVLWLSNDGLKIYDGGKWIHIKVKDYDGEIKEVGGLINRLEEKTAKLENQANEINELVNNINVKVNTTEDKIVILDETLFKKFDVVYKTFHVPDFFNGMVINYIGQILDSDYYIFNTVTCEVLCHLKFFYLGDYPFSQIVFRFHIIDSNEMSGAMLEGIASFIVIDYSETEGCYVAGIDQLKLKNKNTNEELYSYYYNEYDPSFPLIPQSLNEENRTFDYNKLNLIKIDKL